MNTTLLLFWWPSSLGMGMRNLLPLVAVPFQVLLFVRVSKNCLITELSWLDLEDALGQRYPKSSLNRKKPWTEPILWRNFSQGTSSLSKFWLDLQIPQIQSGITWCGGTKDKIQGPSLISHPSIGRQVRQWQNSQYKISMTDSALL